jgi:hypothetical protein
MIENPYRNKPATAKGEELSHLQPFFDTVALLHVLAISTLYSYIPLVGTAGFVGNGHHYPSTVEKRS